MTATAKPQNAVIYCRTASTVGNTANPALGAQQLRCRRHAEEHGLAVARVFEDQVSGLTADRPGMNALMEFVAGSDEPLAVIVNDPSRIDRDIAANLHLRNAIRNAGGVLMCAQPTMQPAAPHSAGSLAAQLSNARQP